ncbi:MAG: hypothetical protein E6767_05675 [Dysgonomonas sp.]|nr:hypothetical protein [Dysgonomonas sp.]
MAKICEIQKKNDCALNFYSVEINRDSELENTSTYDGVLNVFREIFKFIDFAKIIKH